MRVGLVVDQLFAPVPGGTGRYAVPWTHPETLTARGLRFHRRMGARAAMEADLIVTHTAAAAGQIRDILGPRAEVIAVPAGFSGSLVIPDDAQERRTRHVGDGNVLLFVGTAEPRKGLDTLLDALAEPALQGRGCAPGRQGAVLHAVDPVLVPACGRVARAEPGHQG